MAKCATKAYRYTDCNYRCLNIGVVRLNAKKQQYTNYSFIGDFVRAFVGLSDDVTYLAETNILGI